MVLKSNYKYFFTGCTGEVQNVQKLWSSSCHPKKATRSEITRKLLARYENNGETLLHRIIEIGEIRIGDFEHEMKGRKRHRSRYEGY